MPGQCAAHDAQPRDAGRRARPVPCLQALDPLVPGEGPAEGDKKYADAIRRTAKRYNAKIVEDKPWTFETGNRRTDSGAVNERDAIQGFTQVSDYDILIVADEEDQFGEYLTDRTARPRPVAGTQGLTRPRGRG